VTTTTSAAADPSGRADPSILAVLRAGRALPAGAAVRAWTTVGWLLSVEVRAYLEDLDGGIGQPEMRRVVLLRMLEQLVDIDARLGGRPEPGGDHLLALAWEYGLRDILDADGDTVADIFGLRDPFGAPEPAVAAVRALVEHLLDRFPGELPDPLVPDGQRQILHALRSWSKLAVAAGLDASFLEPLLKDA
jgi:hypothetical protein